MEPDLTIATDKALELPELLEIILAYLPPLELLLVQRTSRLWQHVIQNSPHMQKKLFLRADHRLVGRYADNKPGVRPLNNLMLRKVLGGMYPTMTLQLLNFERREDFAAAKQAANFSISLREMNRPPDESAPLAFWAWTVNISFPADVLMSAQANHPAVAYEKASWRRMFLSQPPATTLHLTRAWQRSAEPVLTIEGGITMQHLVEGAEQKPGWDEIYVGGDRDWHLEGPIKYSGFDRDEATK